MLKHLLPGKPGTEPLAEALRACRPHFVWAAVFSAFVNLLYLTPTLYMLQVYDRVVPTGGLMTLVLVTVVAVFALAALAALDWLRGRLMLRAGLRLDRMLSGKVLGRVVDLQARLPNTQALREFDHVRGAISGQGMLALFDAPWTPIYLLCCFLLHPAIGLLTLVGAGVLFGLAWLNERDTRPRLKQAMQSQNSAYAAQEAVAGQAEVVRALGMRQSSIARQLEQRGRATAAQADAQLAGGRYSGAIKFLRLVLQSAALGLAAWLAVNNEISVGAIIASSVLLSRAVAPIEMLVGVWPGLVQGVTSWNTLTELFASTAAVERERTRLPDPAGRLQVEAVTVRFPDTEQPQLRGVSFSLTPGQTLGVVGPSGSGKTTLARVIAGALTPQAGAVRLDGAEYKAREGDELARWIGYLPQVPSLFAGSIKENISRFSTAAGVDQETADRTAVAAAVAAGAHEMILRLPQGYDTVLGPFGQGLSAGQAQRVALARALYNDPVLLVLDEPNSHLDQEGEAALMQAIVGAAARGAAVVVIAHRAGVLARVDRLLMMQDGAIRLEGPRDAVLEKMRATSGRPGAPTAAPEPGQAPQRVASTTRRAR
ncbi:MAG: type I secretion system permease/ATPase [Alphaproteobacteria bacterium]|nr:type I secretion system permease/ATPase [Alphaproteobacteria bacterium]MBU2271203.1 type I secretion system permease/ATPase [Alphaproteobacteria bacterium]MBU2417538.1 type I secretion system permease/ATPase [Alphaproteobacteria bacterium]